MKCLDCNFFNVSSYVKMGFCSAPNGPSMRNIELRARLFIPGECWLPESLRPFEADSRKIKTDPDESV